MPGISGSHGAWSLGPRASRRARFLVWIGGPSTLAPRHQVAKGSRLIDAELIKRAGGRQGRSAMVPSDQVVPAGCTTSIAGYRGINAVLRRLGGRPASVPITPGGLESRRNHHVAHWSGLIPSRGYSLGNLLYWFDRSSAGAGRRRGDDPPGQRRTAPDGAGEGARDRPGLRRADRGPGRCSIRLLKSPTAGSRCRRAALLEESRKKTVNPIDTTDSKVAS